MKKHSFSNVLILDLKIYVAVSDRQTYLSLTQRGGRWFAGEIGERDANFEVDIQESVEIVKLSSGI